MQLSGQEEGGIDMVKKIMMGLGLAWISWVGVSHPVSAATYLSDEAARYLVQANELCLALGEIETPMDVESLSKRPLLAKDVQIPLVLTDDATGSVTCQWVQTEIQGLFSDWVSQVPWAQAFLNEPKYDAKTVQFEELVFDLSTLVSDEWSTYEWVQASEALNELTYQYLTEPKQRLSQLQVEDNALQQEIWAIDGGTLLMGLLRAQATHADLDRAATEFQETLTDLLSSKCSDLAWDEAMITYQTYYQTLPLHEWELDWVNAVLHGFTH